MDEHKILVVDDDRRFQRLLNQKLAGAGFQVVFADDGLGAVTQARKEEPDVILLDLGLPGGDGFSVLERLRRHTQLCHIPIVVVTAWDEKVKERALEAGAVGFFEKPVDAEELIREIRGILA